MCFYSLITLQWDSVNKGLIIKAEALNNIDQTQFIYEIEEVQFNSERLCSSTCSAVHTVIKNYFLTTGTFFRVSVK